MSRVPRPKKGTKADSKAFTDSGRFARFPYCVYQHENHRRLSAQARMLLVDVFMQFYGKNNGDLCIAWSVMKEYGWKSKGTLSMAKKELLHYGLIECTRHGGFHNGASLYAVTWLKIDPCNGKVKGTDKPSGKWKLKASVFQRKKLRLKKSLVTDIVPMDTFTSTPTVQMEL